MTERPGSESLVQQLRAIPFFSGLDDEVLRELARGAIWCEYSTGEVVFLEGERSHGLYYLQNGWRGSCRCLLRH
ncbi:MAG TPA: cyclic nucleotide-binding domain-containing protein [Anaerolineae bacterium]